MGRAPSARDRQVGKARLLHGQRWRGNAAVERRKAGSDPFVVVNHVDIALAEIRRNGDHRAVRSKMPGPAANAGQHRAGRASHEPSLITHEPTAHVYRLPGGKPKVTEPSVSTATTRTSGAARRMY